MKSSVGVLGADVSSRDAGGRKQFSGSSADLMLRAFEDVAKSCHEIDPTL